tara:strand:- start:219 stop:680 length:462 start_codon:yes stop_codon:yes gene_type:complete
VKERKLTSTVHSPKSRRPKAGKAESAFGKGRASELLVAAKLLPLGFDIFFPFSDRSAVDLIVSHKTATHRLQIKSRWDPYTDRGTPIMLGKWNPNLVDFLIVFLAPDSYYVIPVDEIPTGKFNLSLFPYGFSGRKPVKLYEQFKNQWNLLKKS